MLLELIAGDLFVLCIFRYRGSVNVFPSTWQN